MNNVSPSDIATKKFGMETVDILSLRSANSTPKPGETNGAITSLSQSAPIEGLRDAVEYEEFDTASNSSKSTWNPERTSNSVSSQGAEPPICIVQSTGRPIRILVVGSSGAGKTCTVTNSYRDDEESILPHEPTEHTQVINLDFEGQTYEVIDTPGFDNPHMSDAETFAEIANYLLQSDVVTAGINGIIYVHRAGNAIHNRSLLRNFRVLANVFLGEVGVTRLTFLLTQSATHGVDYDGLLRQMVTDGSAFKSVFSAGAHIATFPNQVGFLQLLGYHASQAPIVLSIQIDTSFKSHTTLVERMEKELGYCEHNSMRSLLDNQERQLREHYEQISANQNDLETQLRQQLYQSQLEYSSLRSQLQLQENVEQSQVVQTLKDINRMIEDIGRSVSAYLTDNYVHPTFGKDAAYVNALHARDLPALTTLFCHHEGVSSLIASSNGQGTLIEEFLDYSIRNFLCRFLFYKIFWPFHPEIAPSLNKALLASYKNIQKRGPQSVTGKWRSETFKSLREASGHEATEEEIDRHLHRLFDTLLEPLIRGVFGKDIPLEDIHITSFRTLIKMAWNWNSQLKGGVIMLGDFVQTYFPRSRFDAKWMEEFEAISPDHTPAFILGTFALGLVCQKTAGGGNPMEEIVVCKAVVATKRIFN